MYSKKISIVLKISSHNTQEKPVHISYLKVFPVNSSNVRHDDDSVHVYKADT